MMIKDIPVDAVEQLEQEISRNPRVIEDTRSAIGVRLMLYPGAIRAARQIIYNRLLSTGVPDDVGQSITNELTESIALLFVFLDRANEPAPLGLDKESADA